MNDNYLHHFGHGLAADENGTVMIAYSHVFLHVAFPLRLVVTVEAVVRTFGGVHDQMPAEFCHGVRCERALLARECSVARVFHRREFLLHVGAEDAVVLFGQWRGSECPVIGTLEFRFQSRLKEIFVRQFDDLRRIVRMLLLDVFLNERHIGLSELHVE